MSLGARITQTPQGVVSSTPSIITGQGEAQASAILSALPERFGSLVLRRDGDNYEIWERPGASPQFLAYSFALDSVSSTGMYQVNQAALKEFGEWVPINSLEANPTYSGTWAQLVNSSTISGFIRNSVSGTSYVEFNVVLQEAGDIWLTWLNRNSGGYMYVSINGSADMTCLPRSGANAYIDTYSASDLSRSSAPIAKGLPAGTYTVRLTRASAEKNAASSNYYIYPDSFAPVSEGQGLPFVGGGARIRQHSTYGVTSLSSVLANQWNLINANASAMTSITFGTGDYLHIGSNKQFDRIIVDVSSGNSNSASVTAEYWNGSAWTALTITDGTSSSGRTFNQDGQITFTLPSNWAINTVNSLSAYFIRLTFSAGTSAITTVSCQVDQAYSGSIIRRFFAPGSQLPYALNFKPEGGSYEEIGGEAHGNETNTATTLIADGVQTTLSSGQAIACRTLDIKQTMTVQNDSNNVGSGELVFSFQGNGFATRAHIVWSTAGEIGVFAYSAMLPALGWDALTSSHTFTQCQKLDGGERTEDFSDYNGSSGNERILTGAGSGFLYSSSGHDWIGMLVQSMASQMNLNFNKSPFKSFVHANPAEVTSGGGSSSIFKAYQALANEPGTVQVQIGDKTTFGARYVFAQYA